nr:uncharacterized protein LOC109770597 [Aegilops tauschii subsp. strangulata]
MEELISSGLAGMDISILHGAEGEGEGEDEAEAEDASATREQREEKMKDVRRENHDEYINSTPPPCPSSLGPTRFTFGPIPSYARPHCTMQIFSVRVADLEDGLRWPLHVHGLVAARDTSDHNRNFLFNRTRDNCQVLTQQDPYLLLTGPSRAIVIIDPITIEFQLKVKSKMDPEEDEMLAFGIFNYPQTYLATHVIRSGILCDRCTIELAYAPLDPSVEATVIGVRIIDGVWPEGLRGRVVTEVTTVREGEVLLLDSRDGKMPISPRPARSSSRGASCQWTSRGGSWLSPWWRPLRPLAKKTAMMVVALPSLLREARPCSRRRGPARAMAPAILASARWMLLLHGPLFQACGMSGAPLRNSRRRGHE